MFTKRDLKEFDVVKLRNGDIRIVLRNNNSTDGLGTFKNKGGCHCYLHEYNADLTNCDTDQFDIVAVDRFDGDRIYTHLREFFDEDRMTRKYVNCSHYWDWERTEIKEMTIAEIEKELGHKVKGVKGLVDGHIDELNTCETCIHYDTGWDDQPCCSCKDRLNWESDER